MMTTPFTYDPNVEKVVPVNSVVLNPASGIVWEFLNGHKDATLVNRPAFLLAQEIRKQMPAPKIEEPGWGVIVEAGVKQHDERLRWVRCQGHDRQFWSCENPNEYTRLWSELIDPKVVQP